ncbi:NAD(P)/FAD-dependent oxidoreductase [Niabella aquatica]
MITDYDIIIVGGGLAGLTTAIQLRKKGYSVVLFEKNPYPFHRVCGEYISLESWNYLSDCGIDLQSLDLPVIKKLQVSAPNGNILKADLDLGGFGISRFKLDHLLYEEAKSQGVTVFENTRIDDIIFIDGYYKAITGNKAYTARLALGSFGKRSQLDVKWKRRFVMQRPNKLNNYIGVKYHIKTVFPADTIALHNFRNGYCGISKIEEDKYCLCYLTTAANLQASGGIREMEKSVLYKNAYLQQLFENSEFLFNQPVSISQVSFANKEIVYNHIPLAGDACGMITPLCGNGMSMAMHSGKIFTGLATAYLQQKISLEKMLHLYRHSWRKQFAGRLQTGRLVQNNFGKEWQTNCFICFMKRMPWLTRHIIKSTHGKTF